MTRKKLQKVLRQIAYEENITTWKWSNFEYYLHQNNDDLAVTRTQNGGKARKLLSHEETIRALKVYNVWKTRQYAQAILEVLFEQNSYFETDKDIFYINKHTLSGVTFYSVDKVGINSQEVTSMSDKDVVENEEFKKVIGIY